MTGDPITRGWAVVTSFGVARLALGFIASLAVARALGPADFGVYAVLAATVGVVGAVAEGGLTEAAVLRISSAGPNGAHRARAFFWVRLALATTVVALAGALASPLAELLRVDDGLLRWAVLGIAATAASGAVSAMLQAIGAFGRMSSLTVLNTGLTAMLAVALAVTHRLDLTAALVVLGIGTSLATCVTGWRMLPSAWSLWPPALEQLKTEAACLWHTGRWLWLASLFAMLTANAEILLLNQWTALPLVGAYALALNLATKADLVNHSLYTVLLPGASTLQERGAIAGFIKRGLARSALISLGLLALVPIAEPVIVLVYGADFAPAVVFFRLLIGVMIFDVLLTPLLLLPLAYKQARLLAAAEASRAITVVLLAMALIPVYGVVGAIAARFVARLAGAVLVLGALWSGRATLQVEHEEPAGVS
jgi:O-antigen/teichoic acid export membrane protein